MSGMSYILFEKDGFELAADHEEICGNIDLTVGTGFTTYGHVSCNFEISNLTLQDLENLHARLGEVIETIKNKETNTEDLNDIAED